MICRRDDSNDTSTRHSGARLHAPQSEDKACALAQSDQRGHERASEQDSRSKRTSCAPALAAGLGAVCCQRAREHLRFAVLGNLRAGFPRYTRILFVRAPTRRRARRPSWAFQKQRHGASYLLAWQAAPGRGSAVPTRLLKADPKDCRIEYAHCHAVLKRMLQCSQRSQRSTVHMGWDVPLLEEPPPTVM